MLARLDEWAWDVGPFCSTQKQAVLLGLRGLDNTKTLLRHDLNVSRTTALTSNCHSQSTFRRIPKMAGSTTNYTSFATLRAVGIAMIVVSTIIFAARTAARFSQRGWRLQVEDLLVSLAYVFFLAMSIAYMIVIDPIYRLSALENGELAPSVALLEDADLVTKVFFCTTILLWLCLWSVKLAFLALYRRLMKGLPTYLRWWWGILGFTILVCINVLSSSPSTLLSCSTRPSSEPWSRTFYPAPASKNGSQWAHAALAATLSRRYPVSTMHLQLTY